jgi:hypothetical protein
MSGQSEVFFHVGLGKVASTYLQHRFFPKLQGITYLSTHRYKKSKQLIMSGSSSRWLVSREFDRQFEKEVRWFTETFPHARVIMIVRPHGSWVASQYRRYVKNGWYHPFNRFLDVKNDEGFWVKSDVPYFPRIQLVEELTGKKPLVLLHQTLKEDPWNFLNQIAGFCGATYDQADVSLKPYHTSYSEKQLLVLRSLCRKYVKKVPTGYQNKVKHWLFYRPWWAFFHLIMYTAQLFPNRWVPQENLTPRDELDLIDEFYKEDWAKVIRYVESQEIT